MNLKRVIVIASIILALYWSSLSAASTIDETSSFDEFTSYLDERIPVLMEKYDIPGVNIAFVEGGQLVWSKAYGFADMETGRLMTTDTICRVESISKSVTAWGVLRLVEQGKVDLDDPVAEHITSWSFPESSYPVGEVTVRQLLSHTSGMPLGTIGVRYSPEGYVPSLEERLSQDAVLVQEPGKSFAYSNTGFNLLELLVEDVTGREFADYMAEEVLEPLGMYDSSYSWSPEFDPEVPFGYDHEGNPISVYVYPDKASGGLFSTVEDIARLTIAGMKGSQVGYPVISSQGIETLYEPVSEELDLYGLVFDAYGFGHYVEGLSSGERVVSHGGQGSGWMSQFFMLPETGDGIIILANSQRSWPFFANVLTVWSDWNGFSTVGMGRIVLGVRFLTLFVLAIFSVSFAQAWRVLRGLYDGDRRFDPISIRGSYTRLAQGCSSIILGAVLLWAVKQDYLFIRSVFPVVSVWLGYSILALALVLFISAVFPTMDRLDA